MLLAEARWIGRVLQQLPDEAFPLLNLGSSTLAFRQEQNPWIDAEIFRPLRSTNRRVIHVDMKVAPGVDVVCDFTDDADREVLRGLGARSVLCSNLLEHLAQQPSASAVQIAELVDPGGAMIVTVPRQFPYHPDPIDNGFRPSPAELAGLFSADLVTAQEVACHRMAYYYADAGRRWPRFVARMSAPVVRPDNWYLLAKTSFQRATASCVLLRRR